jgi:hypothetical protein
MKLPKQKPSVKEKSQRSKGRHGETISTENAVEFMIKERQLMDREFAALRAENDELKDRVDRQQQQPRPQSQQPERVIVEKVIEKKVVDPNSLKWKQDAEALRKENEELKRQHAETQAIMKTQRQLALEAQEQHSHLQTTARKEANSSSVERKDDRFVEEKDDPEDSSAFSDDESQEGVMSVRRRQSEDNLPPRPLSKSRGVPALDLSHTHNSNSRPTSAPSTNKSRSKDVKDSSPNYSGLPLLLWKGGILWKIPYNGRGRPERRHVMIKKALKPGKHARSVRIITKEDSSLHQTGLIYYPPTIMWANPDKPDDLQSARELTLFEGAHVVEGYQSSAFWKSKTGGE